MGVHANESLRDRNHKRHLKNHFHFRPRSSIFLFSPASRNHSKRLFKRWFLLFFSKNDSEDNEKKKKYEAYNLLFLPKEVMCGAQGKLLVKCKFRRMCTAVDLRPTFCLLVHCSSAHLPKKKYYRKKEK
jgi:hypothetical protein